MTWKDFVFDDVLGPLLVVPTEGPIGCKKLGGLSIMEDAIGSNEARDRASIQETGQEQRPARMVGLPHLDSARSVMDDGLGIRAFSVRQREER